MKTIIVYQSTHHGNTKKLVDAISEKYRIETVDIKNIAGIDLNTYDQIGLAAGIAFGNFYKAIEQFAETLPSGKDVFLLYTCGAQNDKYTKSISTKIQKQGCNVIGSYGCLGFDTFGPYKLVGGVAKGHPTDAEVAAAVEFYGKLQSS